jgi:hypothetical protein
MPSEHAPRVAPTPGCSFVARQAFEYGGRAFQPGDPFPYADFGMTEEAAWNFWQSAMIVVAPPTVSPVAQRMCNHTLYDASPPAVPAAAVQPPKPKHHKRW